MSRRLYTRAFLGLQTTYQFRERGPSPSTVKSAFVSRLAARFIVKGTLDLKVKPYTQPLYYSGFT